jgi:hypothetical protein
MHEVGDGRGGGKEGVRRKKMRRKDEENMPFFHDIRLLPFVFFLAVCLSICLFFFSVFVSV